MNILLIGSGGREHALAFVLAKSPLLTKLFIAPGNPGTAEFGENVVIDVTNHQAVIDFCKLMKISFVMIGPEMPLVAGLVDDLAAANIKAFGPKRAAAQLEGSKGFTKTLCKEFNIPTAAYEAFQDAPSAKAYIIKQGAPIVIKYDGLMAGKGVTVATTLAEANQAVDAIFDNEPQAKIVIEECMTGEEVSFFCLSDGTNILPFGSAQDHKRAYDGDKGPNTGGMGAYSPAPIFTTALEQQVINEIIKPTVAALKQRSTPYVGVLFAGLMLTPDGPKLIEYNARFGDPECQVLMLRLKDDLLTLLLAAVDGQLDRVSARWRDDFALTIVMASNGYPGSYQTGSVIEGVKEAGKIPSVKIFHAGTKLHKAQLLGNGGRVLNVSASAPTISAARDLAYNAIEKIKWSEGFYRKDIAWRALKS